jgi:DNA-binding MarR family transcriptional regulator
MKVSQHPDYAPDPTAEATIEQALVRLVRRATDPRGNSRINERAGVDLERSGSSLLFRIAELEPARLSTIAEAAGVEASTASRQVARLVDKSLVDRVTDPVDRRASMHRLTDEGHDVHQRLRDARADWISEVLETFSEAERTQLATLLDRLINELIADTER